MQQCSTTVIGYPVQNANGSALPPPAAASATAYPYVNSNTRLHYSAPPHPEVRGEFLFYRCILCIISFFVIALLILWLIFCITSPDVSVQSLSFSDFNVSNLHVNASWNAEFRVSNLNKRMSITYSDVVSTISHGNYDLVETRIAPFSQGKGKGDVSTLDASYSLVDSFEDVSVMDAMNGEVSRGQVMFNVEMKGPITSKYGGLRLGWMLNVWCKDITLTGSSGKMTGGPKRCNSETILI